MNTDNFEILAKRLKQIRTERGMTQKEFAQEMGFTSVTLSAYENSLKRPSLDLILGIAKKCNVSLDWLCGLSDKQNENKEDIQKYKTYSDILNILLEWDAILNISIETINQGDVFSEKKAIVFETNILQNSIKSWHKFRKLFDDGSIDKQIYIACIEKMLRDTKKYPIKDEEVFDDGLPF